MKKSYLNVFGLGLVDEFSILRIYSLEVELPTFHHFDDAVQCVYSISVLLYVIVRMHGLLVFSLHPHLPLFQHFSYIHLLLLRHKHLPLAHQLILHLVNQALILILHVVQRDNPPIILLHFLLHFLHFQPLLLLDLMEVIANEPSY